MGWHGLAERRFGFAGLEFGEHNMFKPTRASLVH